MSTRTWEQEKAYRAKRAAQAIAEMEQATATIDLERFDKAWQVAMRYMNKRERSPYYIAFLRAMSEGRA